jgi:DNA-binding LacI/PurR family transcriptional regulator
VAERREVAHRERDAAGLVDADRVDPRIGRADDDERYPVGDQLVEERTNAVRHESFARACRETGCEEVDPELATGVAAANDIIAIGLIEQLEQLGRRVPRDVSVVGFDGIGIGALTRIGLTTVAQPHEQLAATGIRLLLERIELGPSAPPRQILLEPHLVVRTTTAPRHEKEL